MTHSLTAKEIARQVAGSTSDEDLVLRRISHWTMEKLLVPEELNPGTGRSRLYSSSTVRKARVLNRLTDCGISINTLRSVSEFMDASVFEKIKGLGVTAYLIIKKRRQNNTPDIAVYLKREEADGKFTQDHLGADVEYVTIVKLD